MLVDWIVPVNTVDWSFAVLKDFVRSDAAKGYVESFFSEHTSRLDKEYVERGLSKAIRELLQLVYDELLDNDLSRRELEDWKTDFKEFILTDGVRQALHEAFFNSRIYIDPQLFAKSWEQVSTDHILPESFSWERIAKRLGRAIERLKAEDPLLEKALNAESAHQVIRSQVLTSLNPVSSRELYREALLERYSSLSFQSFDATGIYYKTKLWSLFIPQNTRECDRYYTNVHEIPKEYRTKFFDDSELNYDFGEKVKKFHQDYVQQSTKLVTKVVEDDSTNRLVVLGDPGSGKSMVLRYVALQWAQIRDTDQLYSQTLPILIELKEYSHWMRTNTNGLISYFCDPTGFYKFDRQELESLLKKPKAVIFLLDGLDEVFDPAEREKVVDEICKFSKQYPETKIVITSRVVGYSPEKLAEVQYKHFILQDLDNDQIELFLNRWHEETGNNSSQFKRERLTTAIRELRSIRELAANPLLLTMIVILNQSQELPRDRVDLYQQASRLLLQEWDTEHSLDPYPGLKYAIGYQEKTEILQAVAIFMQAELRGLAGNLIASKDLQDIFCKYLKETIGIKEPEEPTKALINQLRERNFILSYLGDDHYAFVHRTFLEYFCASAIVKQFRQKLSLDFLKEDVFGKYYQNETWHETLSLVANIVGKTSSEQVNEIVNYLLDVETKDQPYDFQRILLAAKCFQEISNPNLFSKTGDRLKEALNNLAELYRSQGRYEQAEPLYLQALEIYKTVLGLNHPDTARSLNNLAGLYDSQGRYEQAEPLYLQALEIRKTVLGLNHPDTASSLNNLALLYYSQGRYEQAEPLYLQALEITKTVLGLNHPSTATSLNNLAELYRSQGRYEQAEPLLLQALEIRKTVLGLNHPDTASSLNNLALLYYSQGRYEQAEPLYLQALEITKTVLGLNHPDTASSLNNLANLYYSQGRYEQAEPLFKQALKVFEKVLGSRHPNTQTARNNYNRLLQEKEKH